MNAFYSNSKTIFQSFMMKVNTTTPIKSRSTSGGWKRTHYSVCDLIKKKNDLSLRAKHNRTLQFFSTTHIVHNSDPSGQTANEKECLNTTAVQNPQLDETVLQNCRKKIVALDCEMIATRSNCNQLARCSVVDFDENVLLDVYVCPTDPIVDFRTRFSGISPHHLSAHNSISFQEGRSQVLEAIKGKVVVGFSITNDLVALQCSIHPNQVVDLQQLPALIAMFKLFPNQKLSLKRASKDLLKRDIQGNTHCSVEDARATMGLFRYVLPTWLHTNKGSVHRLTDDRHYLADKYWKLSFAPRDSEKRTSKTRFGETDFEDEDAENDSEEAQENAGGT